MSNTGGVSPYWDVVSGAHEDLDSIRNKSVGEVSDPYFGTRTAIGIDASAGNSQDMSAGADKWLVLVGGDDLQIVRHRRVEFAGWALAIVAAFVSILIRSTIVRVSVVGCGLVVAALGWGLGSELVEYFARPAVVALPVAVVVRFLLNRRSTSFGSLAALKRERIVVPMISSIGMLIIGTACSLAQTGNKDEVFALPGDDGRPVAILVPTFLYEKLRGRPEVAITEAAIDGRRDLGVGRFKVRYRLFAFSAGPSVLTLPMAGMRVRSVILDGGAPSEIAVAANTMRIPVSGAGSHLLEIEFTAAVMGAAGERGVKFPIPDAPVTRLAFDLPKPGTRLRAGNWRGASSVRDTPAGQHLEADLGEIANVLIRWQDAAEAKPNTRVTAASVWQVGTSSGLLTSVFDYRITNGSLAEFRLAIPAGMEVCRLNARAEVSSAGYPQASIRDWHVRPGGENTGQTLIVEFVVPVTGRLIVRLDLVPSNATIFARSLELPRPLLVTEVEAYVAVAGPPTSDLTIARVDGLVDSSADAFKQTLWKGIDGAAFPAKVARAFRAVAGRPRLTMTVRAATPAQSATESINWWLQPGRLIGISETRWTGTNLSLLEWTLPTDVVAVELSARDLLCWSQRDGRIQAWFERPVTDPTVNWRAYRLVARGGRIDVPVAGHPSATSDDVTSRVRALDGWTVEPDAGGPKYEWLPPQSPTELGWRSAGGRSVGIRAIPPKLTR